MLLFFFPDRLIFGTLASHFLLLGMDTRLYSFHPTIHYVTELVPWVSVALFVGANVIRSCRLFYLDNIKQQ